MAPLDFIYPDAVIPGNVGKHPASSQAGGGYVWDEVLEYRVWCYPRNGAADIEDGCYYYYAFVTFLEAKAFAEATNGANDPLALILQQEYIEELREGGVQAHQRETRYRVARRFSAQTKAHPEHYARLSCGRCASQPVGNLKR